MNKTFSPLDSLARYLKYWWILVICILIGCAAGFGLSYLIVPEYEAAAIFNVTMDFPGVNQLTNEQFDFASYHVGSLLMLPEIVDPTIAELNQQGVGMTADEFARQASVERRLTQNLLIYRDEDPVRAATVVNTWSVYADEYLRSHYESALKAGQYRSLLRFYQDCLYANEVTGVSSVCRGKDIQYIESQINLLTPLLLEAEAGSAGMFSGLVISSPSQAAVPTLPVRSGKGGLLLAGVFVGLIVGIFLLEAGFPRNARKEE